ncbi:MAG: UDP-N-acetylmuramoyl-tripeptide--D-alanyl-D-alanine ligase [Pseudomonadota bacterium]
MFRTTVIAVTGSVGKTTCRELLISMLESQGSVHRTENNENDMWSIPSTILRMRPWHRYSVMETAASGRGSLKAIAEIVRPDIAIVTAVAPTHTKEYSDLEDIAREKSELVRNLARNGVAVLNADDLRVAQMKSLTKREPVTFGQQNNADVMASDVSSAWPQRLKLKLNLSGQFAPASIDLQSNLVGRHWSNSFLAASTTAAFCGVPHKVIQEAITSMPPFRARMEPIRLPNGAVAIQDNNASDVVFLAMLDVAKEAQAERKVVILGDLNDIEGMSRSRRRRVYAAQQCAEVFDVMIFVGSGTSYAVKAGLAAGVKTDQIFGLPDFRQASQVLRDILQPHDLIFVKGQNGLHLRRVVFEQIGKIGCAVDSCQIRSDCDVCDQLKPEFDLARALRWD